jgi:CRISPR/Cas system CMR subunit Cmr4 (Cas7 group RAMP superfamily)
MNRGVVVVSDNMISEVVRRSLLVQPRIRLDYKTKTVVAGALWGRGVSASIHHNGHGNLV